MVGGVPRRAWPPCWWRAPAGRARFAPGRPGPSCCSTTSAWQRTGCGSLPADLLAAGHELAAGERAQLDLVRAGAGGDGLGVAGVRDVRRGDRPPVHVDV